MAGQITCNHNAFAMIVKVYLEDMHMTIGYFKYIYINNNQNLMYPYLKILYNTSFVHDS